MTDHGNRTRRPTWLGSIFGRLLMIVAGTAILVGATVHLLSYRTARQLAEDTMSGQARLVAEYSAAGLAGAIRFRNAEEMELAADRTFEAAGGTISRFYVRSSGGEVLLARGKIDAELAALADVALRDGSVKTGGGLIWAAPSLASDGTVVGVVAIAADTGRALARVRSGGTTAIGWSLGVMGLCLLLSALFLRRSVTAPLGGMHKAMTQIAEQDFDIDVPAAKRNDELGMMARDVVRLRDDLAQTTEQSRMVLYQSAAFSGASVPMVMVDKDRVVVAVNRKWEELLESRRELFGSRWPDLYDRSLVGQCIDRFHERPEHQAALFADLSRQPHVSDIKLDDDTIELYLQPITDKNGDHVGNILEWRLVTDERLNAGMIDTLRVSRGLITYDTGGRIVQVNDNVLDWTGYGRDELVGANVAIFSGGEDATMAALWDQARAGELARGQVRRRARDGANLWIELTLTPIFDRAGNVHRLVELSTDVTAAETARLKVEEEKAAAEAAQARVVGELGTGLAALAGGDLTFALDRPFAAEYDQLRRDFNRAVGQLAVAIGDIAESSVNIVGGAGEIAQSSDDLSRRTENQAATLEQTAAALDQLTSSVKSASENASTADSAVADASQNAESGGAIVLQAVDAMKEIEQSSDQISRIISVIDDIAFQTNLLALNAGVEAARAGDAGRGFAVVASEVRALAQRSSEAAKEIKNLISASSGHVQNGVSLVGKSGEALGRIVESVENIKNLVTAITSASREQATGLSEINAAVEQLDDVTQQNAAMVEQSTAASHTMRSEAERLQELISAFRTGVESGALAAAPGPAARSKAETGALSDGQVSENDGADAHMAPAGARAGWEDF